MPAHQALLERLFEPPGQRPKASATLLGKAAACHRRLLSGFAAGQAGVADDALRALLATSDNAAGSERAIAILNHPLLVDALHALAPLSPELQAWDDATAAGDPGRNDVPSAACARQKLNSVAWPFLLRQDPSWRGRIDLCTDAFGFLRFPFCDWCLWLRTESDGDADVLADASITVSLDADAVCWSLSAAPDAPFMVMPRRDCERWVVENDPQLSLAQAQFPNLSVRPRFLRASPLGSSGLRYEPVGFDDATFAAHAGLTGALVRDVLSAIEANAPAIHGELRQYLTTIRGYELPAGPDRSLASFSVPNLPGIMNINIVYTEDDQPLLSPFCFTWVGHELGHTKHYLIDDAVYQAGPGFVRNPGDRTSPLPRYQRSIAVRTLFQIPYVHLYELELLTAFLDVEFASLPWDVAEDPAAFGDDLVAELAEAFDLLPQWADLTALGQAAVDHLRGLFDQALSRWQTVRDRRTS